MNDLHTLASIFLGLMGFAVFMYAILDGYDLGVGILLSLEEQHEAQRDLCIASIGPFWDANETWLVLAVGLMLVAFPTALNVVLYELYVPATLMLIGLILRGVAFDFRAKAAVSHKLAWDRTFKIGSLIAALSQGFMLGRYVTGFDDSIGAYLFAVLSAVCVCSAFTFIGACWLILKTEGELRDQSLSLARWTERVCFLGIAAVSGVNLLLNPGVIDRWFEASWFPFSLLIPVSCALAFAASEWTLTSLRTGRSQRDGVPYLLSVSIFASCVVGLGLSYYPDIIPGRLSIWEAVSSAESLKFILLGATIVVPTILLYTIYSYYVFRGKAGNLEYY